MNTFLISLYYFTVLMNQSVSTEAMDTENILISHTLNYDLDISR